MIKKEPSRKEIDDKLEKEIEDELYVNEETSSGQLNKNWCSQQKWDWTQCDQRKIFRRNKTWIKTEIDNHKETNDKVKITDKKKSSWEEECKRHLKRNWWKIPNLIHN